MEKRRHENGHHRYPKCGIHGNVKQLGKRHKKLQDDKDYN